MSQYSIKDLKEDKPQKITVKKALASVRKAFKNRTLQIFCPDRAKVESCAYVTFHDGKEYNCAIGSVLTKKTRQRCIEESVNGDAMCSLETRGIVSCEEFWDSTLEGNPLHGLQSVHDVVCAEIGRGGDRRKCYAQFNHKLKELESKYA